MKQAEKIYTAFISKDPNNESNYTNNWNSIKLKFENLDTQFQNILSNTKNNDIFVTHAAYGYLAERYGFVQNGIIGVSADEQPSAKTIAYLVDLMIKKEIYVLYYDPVYSDEYVQTLKTTLESKIGGNITSLPLYLMIGPFNNMDYFQQQERNIYNLKIGLDGL
jgi:zinc transport system substrate-binding protein